MICVFDVIEGPATGKRFWLKPNERVEVGRLSRADVSVPSDQHMSRHHLVIEAFPSLVRVRDAGSTNGTYVNDSRVSSFDLCAGDRIRAGKTLIEVSFVEEPQVADQTVVAGAQLPKGALDVTPYDALDLPTRVISYSGELAAQDLGERAGADKHVTQRIPLVDDRVRPGNRLLERPTFEAWYPWSQFFQNTTNPGLFERPRDSSGIGRSLADFVASMSHKYLMHLVVNQYKLGKYAQQLYEDWRREGIVVNLSHTLDLISNDHSQEFLDFILSTEHHDAIVILGSPQPLDKAALEPIIDYLGSPSVFASFVESQTPQIDKFLPSQIGFIAFESSLKGPWRLIGRSSPS